MRAGIAGRFSRVEMGDGPCLSTPPLRQDEREGVAIITNTLFVIIAPPPIVISDNPARHPIRPPPVRRTATTDGRGGMSGEKSGQRVEGLS